MSWIVEDAIKQRNIERVRKLVELVGYEYGEKRKNHSLFEYPMDPTKQLESMIVHELGYKSDLKVEEKLEEKYDMEITISGDFRTDFVIMKPRKPIMLQNTLPIIDYLYELRDAGYLLSCDASTEKLKADDFVEGEKENYKNVLNGWYIVIHSPKRKAIVDIETEFSHADKDYKELVSEPKSMVRVYDSHMEDPKTKEILDNIAVHVLGLKNPYDNKIEK